MITDAKLERGELEFIVFGRERYRVQIHYDRMPIVHLVEKIFQDGEDGYYSYQFEREARNITLVYLDLGKSWLGRWWDRRRLRRAAHTYYSKEALDALRLNTALDAFAKPVPLPVNNHKMINLYTYDLKRGE